MAGTNANQVTQGNTPNSYTNMLKANQLSVLVPLLPHLIFYHAICCHLFRTYKSATQVKFN